MRNSKMATRMLVVASAAVMVMALIVKVGGANPPVNNDYCETIPDGLDPPPHPDVPSQYTAKMEVVGKLGDNPDLDAVLAMYVEEIYDGPGNIISMEVSSKFVVMKYIFDWNTNQTIEIHKSKSGHKIDECIHRPLSSGAIFFPPIWGADHNLSLSHIVGPGTLLGIVNWTEAHYKGQYIRRGMSAERWDWCGLTEFENEAGTKNVSMATYWSSPEWRMSYPPMDGVTSFPLGWEVEIREPNAGGAPGIVTKETLIHNIMGFAPNVVDYSAFLIPDDLYCDGYVPPDDHTFPDFSKDRLFTFSMEMRETDVQDFSWADGWYDFEKQLYRIDHDISTARDTITATEIFDFNDGIAYNFPKDNPLCRITIINDTKTDWSDITGISHLWADSPNAFFGTDITNYTHYGPKFVRSLEGQEWRGLREDWPSDATGGKTRMVWQWTFAAKNVSTVTNLGEHTYMEKQVPIGLRVTALDDIDTSHGKIPKGTAYVYQLYDFNLESEARSDIYSDSGDFDVYVCYSANWRNHLTFKLDVSSWPEVVDTPLLTARRFQEYWQVQLAKAGRVSNLRITRVKTIVEDHGEVWVEWVILARHPTISQLNPALFETMTPMDVAVSNISDAINAGSLRFEGAKPDGTMFELNAVKDSLTNIVDPICTTTSPPPPPSTTPHSTITPPSNRPTGTTATNRPVTVPSTTTGGPPSEPVYYSGDLAGVGIGLLLTGIAFGAGGTFLIVVTKVHQKIQSCCGK